MWSWNVLGVALWVGAIVYLVFIVQNIRRRRLKMIIQRQHKFEWGNFLISLLIASTPLVLAGIGVYFLVRIPVPDISNRIAAGELAPAIWLGLASLAAGQGIPIAVSLPRPRPTGPMKVASLAPEVKITCPLQPIAAAMRRRASSNRARAARPSAWGLDGLAQFAIASIIASRAAGSIGVVAA